ncbi:uncharacterized protein LOC122534974 [Frieseomelitta varia]|uniref:uncharacterized protein LOC122534974 n=1 Tax=Frieseomelitta varia TaxID=561572 RepID=UPI001CB67B0C|nr:uncharacterized protein LOC122534974 [Frieseomelitta varia]
MHAFYAACTALDAFLSRAAINRRNIEEWRVCRETEGNRVAEGTGGVLPTRRLDDSTKRRRRRGERDHPPEGPGTRVRASRATKEGGGGGGVEEEGEEGEGKEEIRADENDLEKASSGRRVAARDSRAGEEDWTKRKKQNKTSKAEEAEEHRSKRRAKARRVEAGLRRK